MKLPVPEENWEGVEEMDGELEGVVIEISGDYGSLLERSMVQGGAIVAMQKFIGSVDEITSGNDEVD